jgi:sugar lactone lactonase YvrE
MIAEKEQPPVGPESFAIGKDGDILVADVVNQRVVVYSSDGAYLRSTDLPGIALGDVTADKQGRVYVYDQVRRALHQYDADGTPRNTLDLNPKDIDTRGYFHVTGNAIYFADAAARDVLVATVQDDGLLVAADKSAERTTDGIHAESGRIYSLSVDRGQALRLQVREPAAQSVERNLQLPLPGIVSALYAGEDEAQRFYVQTERLAGTSIVLEVLAFSPAGEQLAATRMPENNYAIWTAKLVDVRTDGTIVQFLPQPEQAKLNLFAN